ncbi:beta-sarcoglycan [Hyalella azteca]|uniref:Beta-sarcoglycan n=1 Tax=Hyalella azteca TaxID=294128 RepID=A0A8B7NRV2_HYAAZ|nr:beta-sarcoglycan [Hyalella azteca]
MATDEVVEVIDSSSTASMNENEECDESNAEKTNHNHMNRLVDDGLVADSSLERATLTRCSARKLQAQYRSVVASEKVQNDGSFIFWLLVLVLLVLALGNLALTFFAMGVLRLGIGMESIEFITSDERMLKFFGMADLGIIQQQNGAVSSYAGEPLSIVADNSQISVGLNTVRPSPAIHVTQQALRIHNVERFMVVEPQSGEVVFSTAHPSFGVPRGVKNLQVQRTQTSRFVSPTFSSLRVRADSTIRLKGSEGVSMEGRTIEWSADEDIFLRSLNGSLVLDGGSGGIFVEVNNLPLAGPVDHTKDRGQYKLCVCSKTSPAHVSSGPVNLAANETRTTLAEGQLFRVPVPLDNMRRSARHRITCASFLNPCMQM